MRRHVVVLAWLLLQTGAAALAAPGREFWAVLSADVVVAHEWRVLLSNPDGASTASVTVETETGIVTSVAVAPGSTQEVDLGIGRSLAGTALVRSAYRITSDVDIHASQHLHWRPGGGSGSLLLDRRTLGREYVVLAVPGTAGAPERASVVTAVAPGPTQVTVVPASDTLPGAGVPALTSGDAYVVDLEAFDGLQLTAVDGGDLTGTTVSSSGPVEVFAGCLRCHIDGSAADMVQEIMLPVSWWGTSVVAAASNPLTTDVNKWRILAAEDGTNVSTDPAMPGTPVVLGRGEFVEFASAADFSVSADKRVLVGRLNRLGSGGPGASDPALCLMLPEERFIRQASFALPAGDLMFNLLDIVARPGTTVTVDGAVVPAASFLPVGTSGFSHAQVQLSNTTFTHRIEADRPIAAYAANAQNATASTFPADVTPPDLAPSCDASGPYSLACAGTETEVPLDASASTDPEGRPLSFRWSSTSPAVSFDDPASAAPTARVVGVGVFPVDLEVGDGVNWSACSTTITVTGEAAAPPEVGPADTPLWLVRRAALVLFTWEDLGGAPMSYSVYEGRIRDIDGHLPLACNVAGDTRLPGRREVTLAPGARSRYYLVTAANCAAEGPSGMDEGASACPP